jgi:hypothetical protein
MSRGKKVNFLSNQRSLVLRTSSQSRTSLLSPPDIGTNKCKLLPNAT